MAEEVSASQFSRRVCQTPLDFVTNVLKQQFGNCEEFLAFERHFYYQAEEIKSLKATNEQLQTCVSKLQEEKRSLEVQLVSEKVLRDQESRTAAMEVEKNAVQSNAQNYAMKCEVESWKRKTHSATAESTLLKEQMKVVEREKNQVEQNLVVLKTQQQDFQRSRQMFETFSRRIKELVFNANKKIDELEKSKEHIERITEGNQQQLDLLELQLRNWKEDRGNYHGKIIKLEDDLIKAKAEIVQSKSKLERSEQSEKQTAELVDKLVAENKDLRNGLSKLTDNIRLQIHETNIDLEETTKELNSHFKASVERLNESHFTPPIEQSPDIIELSTEIQSNSSSPFLLSL